MKRASSIKTTKLPLRTIISSIIEIFSISSYRKNMIYTKANHRTTLTTTSTFYPIIYLVEQIAFTKFKLRSILEAIDRFERVYLKV